jgi:flagellar L-ring protein precursor FlgH
MRLSLTFSVLAASLLLSGCTAKLIDPEMTFTPPKYAEEMPSREDDTTYATQGSMFGQGDNPLFSDHKAMHVNDLVTVVIIEKTSSSNKANKALAENDTSALGGGVFASAGGNGAVDSAINRINGLSNVGFTSGSTSSYAGSGSASKDASFTTTVAARVVKVMSNGNYFIVGRREIMVDGQKQIMQISGVIRLYDIDQYNQINSSKMSDAKIMYANEGDIDRSTNQGWGTKMIQAVWPF